MVQCVRDLLKYMQKKEWSQSLCWKVPKQQLCLHRATAMAELHTSFTRHVEVTTGFHTFRFWFDSERLIDYYRQISFTRWAVWNWNRPKKAAATSKPSCVWGWECYYGRWESWAVPCSAVFSRLLCLCSVTFRFPREIPAFGKKNHSVQVKTAVLNVQIGIHFMGNYWS